jgi:hypothetical protein
MMPVFDLEPIRHQLHEKPLATKKTYKIQEYP